MTRPRLIRFAGLPVSRWANGNGETVEIAREPASDPFAWRLSIATISEASVFSPLPGVARRLMALTAGPLALTRDGVTVTLARYESVAFTGDQDVAALAPPSPQRDLNLMVRGGIPSLDAVTVVGSLTAPVNTVAVVALEGQLVYAGTALEPGDTVTTGSLATVIDGEGIVALATVHPPAHPPAHPAVNAAEH